MSHWVALFRGINVGGHNRLPMKSLVAILEGHGCIDVKTYIQSGNAVFSSSQSNPDTLPDEIRHSIKSEHGFEPVVLLLSASALAIARDANPFPEGEPNPSRCTCISWLRSQWTSTRAGSKRFKTRPNVMHSWRTCFICMHPTESGARNLPLALSVVLACR